MDNNSNYYVVYKQGYYNSNDNKVTAGRNYGDFGMYDQTGKNVIENKYDSLSLLFGNIVHHLHQEASRHTWKPQNKGKGSA